MKNRKKFGAAFILLAAFILWTAVVSLIDVQAIGPNGSSVGFSTLNGFVHNLTDVHWTLYVITDWLGLIPVGFMLGFALLGLVQWIKRKRILRVDRSILVLGGFYILVIAAYIFFELIVVNYRPVLINGFLEASYPSSTTLLVLTVMPTGRTQLKNRIRNSALNRSVETAIICFIIFMVVGRLLSGVHWVTDIIGGILLSAGLVMMYNAVLQFECEKR